MDIYTCMIYIYNLYLWLATHIRHSALTGLWFCGTLELSAQRGGGCPIHGNTQGWVGWGSVQLDLVMMSLLTARDGVGNLQNPF